MSAQPTATQWDAEGNLEVLTFNLGAETFALEATLVREILDLLPETRVPGAAPLLGSVVNFRGKIIPIADLRLAFAMPAAEATVDSRIVVIETQVETDAGGETFQIGIRTDKVHEVATLQRAASEEPPAVGMRWRRDFVRELVRRQDGVVVLPDLAAIFHSLVGGTDAASQPSTVH
ncbi:purine-binding chemotaxis protein CheW [Novosphingobium sp. PhB57]|jgi:purine-binding chemotaxis protein CheW|uniref:chemotaxis protein CheW n=1 Tax=unclassified Novosphingobium TaxID=2644732 RepID=UPI00104C219F|nr:MULTISPECIES: chemotaxis protein CheW [unclassified Novosphingobium]TCU58110.1 purine-binding chemotaxis protein CheW [Novosphingobium sp. PhB57]TDW64296.1 purine-binding chemotaxis protein CheW [Novosphingobium sp. PhB55]